MTNEGKEFGEKIQSLSCHLLLVLFTVNSLTDRTGCLESAF